MGYLKKNVNLLLLLLIVVVLGSMIGLTTYYQNTYRNISASYTETVEQVNLLTKNLTVQKMELNSTLSQLKIKSEDKTTLDRLYGELSSDNEQLRIDLTSTLEALASTKASLETSERNLLLTQEELARKTAQVENYQEEIEDLEDEVFDLRKEICTLDPSQC
ncbi:hypothetical protein JXB11_02845 [Candidatus Woesearchaeota archaeon]|nr:hypothetical protein [Candidatus Woesearchaeota archaeon]